MIDKYTVKCQMKTILYSRIYYIFVSMAYVFFALWDPKNGFSIRCKTYESFIYRLNFQQFFTIFLMSVFIYNVINQKYINLYKSFFHLYIEKEKTYFISMLINMSVLNIIPFIVGHIINIIINIKNKEIVILFICNGIIVTMEIVSAIALGLALIFLLRKDVLAWISYIAILFILLVINNIYLGLPLSMGILEKGDYYTNFSAPLWIGRMLNLVVCITLFTYTLKRFVEKEQ